MNEYNGAYIAKHEGLWRVFLSDGGLFDEYDSLAEAQAVLKGWALEDKTERV